MLSVTLLALPERKGLELFTGTTCQSLLQILWKPPIVTTFLPFLTVDLTFGMSQKVAQNQA